MKAGEWADGADGTVTAAGIDAAAGRVHGAADRDGPGRDAALPGNTGLVVLDTAVTPELAAEGTAKDVVRLVQQARRDAGLDVSDRITLVLDAPPAVLDAVRAHEAFMAGEVLATSVTYGSLDSGATGTVTAPDGTPAEARTAVRRAS